MEGFQNVVLPRLKDCFGIVVPSEQPQDGVVILRSTIATDAEVSCFLAAFQKYTSTSWIVYKSAASNPKRLTYHKIWKCKRSSYNKSKTSKRDANCQAFVDVLIKKVTPSTKRRDPYLKGDLPHVCEIKLLLVHTHNINTASCQRMLRVDDAVRQKYWQYFILNMMPSEAQRLHQNDILKEENGTILIGNASYNPTLCQVNRLYNSWRELIFSKLALGEKCPKLDYFKNWVSDVSNPLPSEISITNNDGTPLESLLNSTPICIQYANARQELLNKLASLIPEKIPSSLCSTLTSNLSDVIASKTELKVLQSFSMPLKT